MARLSTSCNATTGSVEQIKLKSKHNNSWVLYKIAEDFDASKVRAHDTKAGGFEG